MKSLPKISGYQRAHVTMAWIKAGRPGKLEDYIKKVCKLKELQYVAPNRNRYE